MSLLELIAIAGIVMLCVAVASVLTLYWPGIKPLLAAPLAGMIKSLRRFVAPNPPEDRT